MESKFNLDNLLGEDEVTEYVKENIHNDGYINALKRISNSITFGEGSSEMLENIENLMVDFINKHSNDDYEPIKEALDNFYNAVIEFANRNVRGE